MFYNSQIIERIRVLTHDINIRTLDKLLPAHLKHWSQYWNVYQFRNTYIVEICLFDNEIISNNFINKWSRGCIKSIYYRKQQ